MSDLLRYWQQALKQPQGIKVKVSDRVLFRQQLYRARDNSDDKPIYMGLTISFPKTPDNELWIVHREQENADG